jgi:hypothetical protein
VLLARDANPEMNIGIGVLRVAARAELGDRVAFVDRRALLDSQGAEVREGDRVSARGCDRQTEPVRRNGAREGHRAAGRGANRLASICADVDAAVLAARVGVGAK